MNNLRIDTDCNVFVSDDGKFYITTYKGSPCFERSSHDRLLILKGFDKTNMVNFTASFCANGKGQSIHQFLNKA